MGRINVDAMLRQLTARQWLEWEAYARIDPFSERRADYRIASLATLLANINRDSKKQKQPFKIDDFLLSFGDEAVPKKQSWQEQKRIAYTIAAAFNAAFKEQPKDID